MSISCSVQPTKWERITDQMVTWVPYVTLVISTLALLTVSADPWPDRLVTLGLAGLAGTWVLFGFTLAPRARQERLLPMAIYFVGFLAFASVLTAMEVYFFIFTITGFFHAFLMRRTALVFLAIFLTSVSINVVTAGFPPFSAGTVALLGSIIAIQTFAIGLARSRARS